MPRTKQVRKKSSMMRKPKKSSVSSFVETPERQDNELMTLVSAEYESREQFLQAFDIYYNNKVKARNEGYERAVESVKVMFNNILSDIPAETKKLPFSKALDELLARFETRDSNSTKNADIVQSKTTSSGRQSRAQKPLESFEFKKPKTPKPSSGNSSRRRSVSASAVLVTAPTTNDSLKTPQMSRRIPTGATITPKVYSDTPMSVMRRPQQGEVAISMSGSPLMVGPFSLDDFPTVNVPLMDGRVFSIIPEPGAPPPDLPEFDASTRKYLQTLRAHLEILAPQTP